MTSLAIETQTLARNFQKSQGRGKPKTTIHALDGVDLRVEEGELFGLLGPNGAGKTTLIKILATLLLPTSGRALVDGIDVAVDPTSVRKRISMVSGGEQSGYGILTVRETLWMFSQFYGVSGKVAQKRIDEMLQVVDLADQAGTKVSGLSTGMRQKLNFARGFMSDPKILFLDEPTLGLDVEAARKARHFIKKWVTCPGKTVLLTTHYMLEADELCDRLAIIDRGRILACDAPVNLKRMIQRESVFHLDVDTLSEAESLRSIAGVRNLAYTHRNGHTELKFILDSEAAIAQVVAGITERGSQIRTLQKTEPTLEDVFIELVGRGLDVDTTITHEE
jgi:ABC-2 type transport system ATP-binding protein